MIPEEIEQALASMLAIQKERQETQIKQGQDIRLIQLGEQLTRLNIDRITAEISIEERLANLTQRVQQFTQRTQQLENR